MSTLKHFSDKDFSAGSCVPKCTLADMNVDFMQKLDRARARTKTSFVILSAYRSKEHELKQGRPGTSSHVERVAVDIRATTSSEMFEIVKALIDEGFTRIGLNFKSNFIHVDDDKKKPQRLIFSY
jgi:uncharacterized protein YcbK (DUF882 family)